jgi:hypothetical protein
LTSPDGQYSLKIIKGYQHVSVVTTGYGDPYYEMTVQCFRSDNPIEPIWQWNEESEDTFCDFSPDSKQVAVFWQMSGCIPFSSGTRYFRLVFDVETGKKIKFDSKDFSPFYGSELRWNLPVPKSGDTGEKRRSSKHLIPWWADAFILFFLVIGAIFEDIINLVKKLVGVRKK